MLASCVISVIAKPLEELIPAKESWREKNITKIIIITDKPAKDSKVLLKLQHHL